MRDNQYSLDAKGINEENDSSEENSRKDTNQNNHPLSLWEGNLIQTGNEDLFQDFFDMEKNLKKFFDRFDDFFKPRQRILEEFADINSSVGKWPPIDLREDDDNYYVDVGISGFNKNDLEINLKEDVMIIYASKKTYKKEEKHRTLHSEIRYRSGRRVVPLTSFKNPINRDGITAKTTDSNIVTITLPKNKEVEKENNKKIEIQ